MFAAKEDDPLHSIMPPEEGQNKYSPNAVKIKPVEDVWSKEFLIF